MDYEKAYKEALERAKHYTLYSTNRSETAEPIKSAIEKIFPELKESEDEKIRKELISFFKEITFCGDKYSSKFTNGNAKNWIAWLEKQGEQKPAWSEDDETYISDVLWCIEQARKIAKDENDMGTTWYAERWLKSLKPQSHCCYNPYKESIKGILEMCARYDNTLTCDKQDFLDNVRVKCKDAIEYEKLHPQPHWKPSQEQINALSMAYKDSLTSGENLIGQTETLKSLYNDLKKL